MSGVDAGRAAAGSAGVVLRPLGGFESLAYNFMLAVVLTGPPVPQSAWTTALAAVQRSTPALNATIRGDAQLGSPVFVAIDGSRPIAATFAPLRHGGQWCEVAGRELGLAFDKSGPLLRVTVLRSDSEQATEVVVTCHHAIADGMSLLPLWDDCWRRCRLTQRAKQRATVRLAPWPLRSFPSRWMTK